MRGGGGLVRLVRGGVSLKLGEGEVAGVVGEKLTR